MKSHHIDRALLDVLTKKWHIILEALIGKPRCLFWIMTIGS